MSGLLQRHEALVNLVEEVRALLDKRFDKAIDEIALDRRRVENLESVVGVSEAMAPIPGETASDRNAPHPFGPGAEGGERLAAFRMLVAGVQEAIAEVRKEVHELRGEVIRATSYGDTIATRLDKEFGVEYESDPPRPLRRSGRTTAQAMGAVEIPKRQNPPASVRKAAKMATPKPTPKRKR